MSCIIVNRRKLWQGAVGIAAVSLLAACGAANSGGGGGLPQTVLTYIQRIAEAVSKIVGDLGSFLPAGIVSKIKTLADEVAALAGQISGASGGSLSGLVQNFVSVVETIISTLTGSGISLPGWLSPVLSAVEALLPLILAAIGVATPRRHMTAGAAPYPDAALGTLEHYLRTPIRR